MLNIVDVYDYINSNQNICHNQVFESKLLVARNTNVKTKSSYDTCIPLKLHC